MIGDTASISLLTGLPGAGKSLRLAEAITQLVEKGEHVYHCNIEGLKIKGVTHWPDARDWKSLPAGAILFVDECQDFFPARRSGEPPEYVRMNRIRHEGIRMVLATQQPDYIDSYLRGLVGRHEHLLRRDGKQESFLFSDNQVMDNIRGKLKNIKANYDHFIYKFNPKYFDCYDSAQTHTMKWQMPALMKKALILGPLALVLILGAWGFVFGDAWAMRKDAEALTAETAEAGGSPQEGSAGKAGKETAAASVSPEAREDYALTLVPRVPHQPWSAPVFDDSHQQARAEPALFCMIAGAGIDATGQHQAEECSCVTEQGTAYQLDQQTCFAVVKQGGVYNPYKAPKGEEQAPGRESDTGAGGTPADMAQSAAPVGAGSEEQQAAYGAFRGNANTAPR